MARAVNRQLRLEPCEDRALPSALNAADNTPAHPAPTGPSDHVSYPPADTTDDDSEYATKGKGSANPPPSAHEPSDPSAEYPSGTGKVYQPAPQDDRAEAAEYGPLSRPAAPPLPFGAAVQAVPAATTPAPAGPPAPIASGVVPAVPTPPVPTPAPAPPAGGTPPETSTAGDLTDPSPVPRSGPEDPPPAAEADPPPAGSSSTILPFVGELDLHVDLARWAQAAGELLDGLDAVFTPLEGEGPWARLGYWALAVGSVGVTVELTRQGLRKKPSEPGPDPNLPGAR